MKKRITRKAFLLVSVLFLVNVLVAPAMAVSVVSPPMVVEKIYNTAQKNSNWKTALATGKQAQIVLMSVSPATNPNNEVGMETHPFDQVILIADGEAKIMLNEQNYTAKTGDLIFIPQGTAHNIINLNAQKPLKIISVYSLMDIPPNAVYPKKSDQNVK